MSIPGRACWCVPERRWSSAKVIEALTDVMVMKGVPQHLNAQIMALSS